jgi:hypothetical protein
MKPAAPLLPRALPDDRYRIPRPLPQLGQLTRFGRLSRLSPLQAYPCHPHRQTAHAAYS